MENLPKNVINKIMFYLSHPVAELIEGTSIMKYMAMRLDREHFESGSPFRCGVDDFMEGSPFRLRQSRIRNQPGLPDEVHYQYAVGYFHCNARYYPELKLEIDWSIRNNEILWEHDLPDFSNSEDSDSD